VLIVVVDDYRFQLHLTASVRYVCVVCMYVCVSERVCMCTCMHVHVCVNACMYTCLYMFA
jgi:hypothetical protein